MYVSKNFKIINVPYFVDFDGVFTISLKLQELKNCNNFADIALNVHRKSVNCSLS